MCDLILCPSEENAVIKLLFKVQFHVYIIETIYLILSHLIAPSFSCAFAFNLSHAHSQ